MGEGMPLWAPASRTSGAARSVTSEGRIASRSHPASSPQCVFVPLTLWP
ncbi:hypothetical protein HMPREF9946_02066 [Acetobacteraceae bacterium AT-5844]|nr:hypothetical protein HMPREF9946_02066 [Acetobacteraceae bacterium AT-5844]